MTPPRTEELELVEGAELTPFIDKPLTVTDFVRYQGASGDMNPAHHDTEFAQRAGFPTPFAVGMLQAGVLATYLTDHFGASAIRHFKVQWREQAWPGDVLTYAAKIVAAARGGRAALRRPGGHGHPADRRRSPAGLGHLRRLGIRVGRRPGGVRRPLNAAGCPPGSSPVCVAALTSLSRAPTSSSFDSL